MDEHAEAWRRWGPYLSERQWGTVREDYSPHGTAWDHVTHDMARSKTYRWGEEGIAGWSDEQQRLCLALALWNGRDPILKERMFGLSGSEGNHGEDVKELYYYVDAVPSHAYQKMLLKYPQAGFPYAELVEENLRRTKADPEYELIDTGVFDGGRYFDVWVEIAKGGPEEVLYRVSVENRGDAAARIHVLPTLWFRNTWQYVPGQPRPSLRKVGRSMEVEHEELGRRRVTWDGDPTAVFCENETNLRRLHGVEDAEGPFKDGVNEHVVSGATEVVNGDHGTKASLWYRIEIPAGGCRVVRVRMTPHGQDAGMEEFDEVLDVRRREADAFYGALQAGIEDPDARRVQRQAYAGMLWSKQYYGFDVSRWLDGDPGHPPPPGARHGGRNAEWRHLRNADVISMPDTWEYPWYAAWDLAFHCLPLAVVDPQFAKDQLLLMTREWYTHPNGQLPAYEWAFSDVNPPVHAWATWRVFQIDRRQRGDEGDLVFLERVFHKLMLNFTWWVNRKDVEGNNIFQGGFLGLDNIGVFDRSAPLPFDGRINQADGTSWMAMYSLNLMRIALELAQHNHVYEDIAAKFFEHFLGIARAMTDVAGEGIGLWDPEDGFYYDVLALPDGRHEVMRLRSLVGLIPLCAVEVVEPEMLDRLPEFSRRLQWILDNEPELAALVSRWCDPGRGERRLLSLLRGSRMKRLLRRMLDETEFLSPYGVRSLSKAHDAEPYVLRCHGGEHKVRYTPGESDTHLFGGNSNWRGPVWFPLNYLLIESLQRFHHYYGDDFLVECPTGSGSFVTLLEAADELAARLSRIFLVDADGRRPVFGDDARLQGDPAFRDHVLFYEYFHGDDGRGAGASHQTGWTGLVAKLLQPRRKPH
jgi:hypothetical protein